MIGFQRWFESNKEKLNLLNRNELVEFVFQAGIESTKQIPIQKLKFGNREIIQYKLKTELTLENQNGFKIKNIELPSTQEELQIELNKNNGINIIDWVQATKEEPCIIEFSKGNIINYSDLVEEQGASCECSRSFIAFIKQSLKFIEIIEVIETCS